MKLAFGGALIVQSTRTCIASDTPALLAGLINPSERSVSQSQRRVIQPHHLEIGYQAVGDVMGHARVMWNLRNRFPIVYQNRVKLLPNGPQLTEFSQIMKSAQDLKFNLRSGNGP